MGGVTAAAQSSGQTGTQMMGTQSINQSLSGAITRGIQRIANGGGGGGADT